jgi:hypothetical protein
MKQQHGEYGDRPESIDVGAICRGHGYFPEYECYQADNLSCRDPVWCASRQKNPIRSAADTAAARGLGNAI